MSTTPLRTLRANVARGVKLLDQKDPMWWNGAGRENAVIEGMVGHIELETLDLWTGTVCILGQRHFDNDYWAGLSSLGLSIFEEREYGFNTSSSKESSILTELWASVIQSRRFPRRKIASDPWIVRVNKTWVRRLAQC